MYMQRMWYVLIHGKQTAVRPGRLVLSECVYLNSPQSLSVLPSITCLRRQRALLGLTHKHTVTLALKIWWYDCMRLCIYCSQRMTNCLCLCPFRMRCCLGSWRRWCFHSGPLWPWWCKRVCNVIMGGGEELLWQAAINRLIDACHANMTHLTHHVGAYAMAHVHGTVCWGQVW